MNLDFLLSSVGIRGNYGKTEVTSVTENVKKVKEGSVFVAIKGSNTDGNCFIDEAFFKGAAVVITDKAIDRENVISVSDARMMLSFLCSAFYSHPQYRMKMIGITGTNGKTTTAEYLRHILSFAGKRCAVIGTLGCRSSEYDSETGYTTPAPEILYKELKKLADNSVEYCIMEVSSQALAQKRVAPIEFEIGIFTNIGTDHTDYHGRVEKYVSAKAKLFSLCNKSLINADDAYSQEFEAASQEKALLYSAKGKYADYMAKNIRYTEDGVSYIILKNGKFDRISFAGVGDIAVYNTLAAASAADLLGVDFTVTAEAYKLPVQVKGRLQKVYSSEFTVYVDYAHTPEALFSVLKALNDNKKGKIICVFGCGGERDKGKREKMGAVSSAFSDITVLTTDNPRAEAPSDIIEDILRGIDNKKPVFVEPDRKKAIHLALQKADKGDIVLIAGKGHEEYQLLCNEKIYFSDELTVKEYLGVM